MLLVPVIIMIPWTDSGCQDDYIDEVHKWMAGRNSAPKKATVSVSAAPKPKAVSVTVSATAISSSLLASDAHCSR